MEIGRVGFVGGGRMATALGKGFVTAGLVPPERISASDVYPGARDEFAKQTGGKGFETNAELVKASDILILAVKPDQVDAVLTELGPLLSKEHLLISICAGITIFRMEGALPAGTKVVRVMPNTPALVGECASGYALGSSAGEKDGEVVFALLNAVGTALPVKEPLLDAVTGLSGSGPAYGFLAIEALSDGGVAAGLPRDVATKLAAQTMLGAAKMVLETGMHPGQLKDMVTSPGGTTIEGVHQLEKGCFRATIMNAVRAAAEKSKALGQK